ncbi:MAG: T9SS type A sorting domain-containing protein [Bacteroidales bacterium]|nr:T9SS type A sorting domain-containing protein [Bacteroidales bacterium]
MQRNKFISWLILLVISLLTINRLQAQETINGLFFNAQLQQKAVTSKNIQTAEVSTHLPFFDDFSTSNIYPDSQKWVDKHVFINKDFPFLPPNTAAATFDVLNENGEVYPNASIRPFKADQLQSVLIRLDSVFNPSPKALSPADSIYFSFFYQPQGRGDKPEKHDSLILQFGYPTGEMEFDFIDSVKVWVDDYLLANQIDTIFPLDTLFAPLGCDTNLFMVSNRILTWGDEIWMPCDSIFKPTIRWNTVWAMQGGQTLEEFYAENNTYFKQVLIPVINPDFFSERFQFRFYNYGSIADNSLPSNRSNVDQWHIDMVYLNRDRNFSDTTYKKISFSERAPSFLKRYQAMPYKQYRADPTNAVRPAFELFITNLDSITHNTTYRYQATQINGNQRFTYDGGNCNLLPFSISGYQTCESGCGAAHACPPVASLFSLDFDRDSTSYLITHYISDSTLAVPLTDSVQFTQGFYNYFAYDDGTPELGYGLEPAGAHMAVQFKMVVPDTLNGVQMLFNRTHDNANNKFFDIVVWRDNNGKPGEEIYRLVRQRPKWDETLYGFHYYTFPDPLVINGTFYIGLMQEEIGSINIGFDASLDNSQYNFYKSDEQWRNSDYPGSIMLRPVVGSSYFVGNDEYTSTKNPTLNIFPNPASTVINLRSEAFASDNTTEISIFDLTGRAVFSSKWQNQLTLDFLTKGMYLIRVNNTSGQFATQKLLIK